MAWRSRDEKEFYGPVTAGSAPTQIAAKMPINRSSEIGIVTRA